MSAPAVNLAGLADLLDVRPEVRGVVTPMLAAVVEGIVSGA